MTTELHSIDDLLTVMVERSASDLHLTVGSPAVIRVNGRLERLADHDTLQPEEIRTLVYRILSTEQQKTLETRRQIDFSHSIPGLARFRVNTYFQRGALGAAFRLIPDTIKTLEQLGLPARLTELADKPRGLVLVTGPTGSGKSTTLAALLHHINRSRHEHILTIEDPIEFLHTHGSCIVNQREIGQDATTFAEGLRAALRQDPDVILVGEMRDLETVSTALTAAETGHLVFATLHTQSAPTTIDRVIDVFPAEQQGQVRVQLASTLQGVVTQTLVPTADGHGRRAALEILIPDDAVRNLIRQAKVEQIYSVMQTSTSRGMQTMEQSLADLVRNNVITPEAAFARSSRPDQLRGLLERSGITNLISRRLPTAPPSRPRPQRRTASGSPWRCKRHMDLKKEIKLSDLVRRPQKKTRPAPSRPAARRASEGGSRRSSVSRSAPPRSRPRAWSTTAAGRSSCSSRASRSSPASSSPARCGTSPRSRRRSTELFRTNKLPRRGVRLGIATNRIGVRSFELEGIDDERQLANAIRFRAYEELSIPADEAVLDYHVVSESVNEAGQRSRRVVLAAAYRDSIDRYVAACKQAGIEVAAVDLEAFALLRAVAPAPARDEQAAVVAVTIGHDRTTLAISDGVVCDFTRVLEWGGANLEDAIARELGLSADEAGS